MNKSISSVGMDVSEGDLVVFVAGRRIGCFDNNEPGLEKLRPKLPPGCQIHIEASGGYDRLARRKLREWGFEVVTHNPQRMRSVAKGLGFMAKNDNLDAEALAKVGPLMNSKPAKNAVQEQLCDVSRTIKSLKDQIAAHRKQKSTPELPKDCVTSHERIIKFLISEVKKLEKTYLEYLKNSEFQDRYKLVQTVPGIGPVAARVLACELPAELENYRPKQISAYAGLAPMDNESGKRKSPRHLRKGNVHLKAVMYMPALTVVRHEEWAKALYTRLLQKGRSFQQAIVAVMRKLLVRAIAVLIRGTAFQAEPPPRVLASN